MLHQNLVSWLVLWAQSTISQTYVIRSMAQFKSIRSICTSWVQCCFKSTETLRTTRDREPRTATSTFTQLLSSECSSSKLLYFQTIMTVRDREPRTATLTFTQLLTLLLFPLFSCAQGYRLTSGAVAWNCVECLTHKAFPGHLAATPSQTFVQLQYQSLSNTVYSLDTAYLLDTQWSIRHS